MLKVSVIILSVEKDPLHRDRILRWLVSCKVIKVIHGKLPKDISEISILIHSPSKTFGDVDIIGKKYIIDFMSPFDQPYTGKLKVFEINKD